MHWHSPHRSVERFFIYELFNNTHTAIDHTIQLLLITVKGPNEIPVDWLTIVSLILRHRT